MHVHRKWIIPYADDSLMCSKSREQLEENLDRWRYVLERRRMKVSRSKTTWMWNDRKRGASKLQVEEMLSWSIWGWPSKSMDRAQERWKIGDRLDGMEEDEQQWSFGTKYGCKSEKVEVRLALMCDFWDSGNKKKQKLVMELKIFRFLLRLITKRYTVINYRNRSGWVVWKQDCGGKAEMVWTCAEGGQWMYWTEHDDSGADREEEKNKITEEVYA